MYRNKQAPDSRLTNTLQKTNGPVLLTLVTQCLTNMQPRDKYVTDHIGGSNLPPTTSNRGTDAIAIVNS